MKKQVLTLMRYYELVKEINNVHKKDKIKEYIRELIKRELEEASM